MITAHTNLADGIHISRVGEALNLSMLGDENINQLQAVIDAYLNTRAHAPQWLWNLSDALNRVPVPAHGEGWK